jgi:hypothetical protein
MNSQEDECETPDLNISGWLQESSQMEFIGFDVSTILVELVDNVLAFLLLEEPRRRLLEFLIWEFDNETIREDGDRASNDSFHDKDPEAVSTGAQNHIKALTIANLGFQRFPPSRKARRLGFQREQMPDFQ